jgi:predicted CXXCH cytochrome family protein
MKMRKAASWTCAVALLSAACSQAARHKALTTFFDGVPPLEKADTPKGQQPAVGSTAPPRKAQGSEHGPYAAKLCDACHAKGATNALAPPADELCAQCHTIKTDKKFMHGPLVSGGCLVCHDPHSSRYPYLLVSDSGSCLDCHDREAVARIEGHRIDSNCTTCHDAHGSDTKYLLK